jgi:hypothetical protein
MSSPTYHVLTLPRVGSAAAGANEIARIGMNALPCKLFVTSVSFVADTAVTADDTNYGVLTVKIGSTTIGTLTTNLAQGNIAAGDVVDLTISGDLSLASGGVMSVTKTYAGSGAALSGVVAVQCIEMRA